MFSFVRLFSNVALPFFPVATAPAGGGTSSVVAQPSTPISGPSVIVGDSVSLSVSTVHFSVSKRDASPTSGSFSLFEQPGITNWASGRASAYVSGDLNVSLIVEVADASAPIMSWSGVVALMPSPPAGRKAPSTLDTLAQCPGSCVLNVTAYGSNPAILRFPPGLQRDALINQVIGGNPQVVYAGHCKNISAITVVVSGSLQLSGLGYPSSFF
jgi:hypothetical protein